MPADPPHPPPKALSRSLDMLADRPIGDVAQPLMSRPLHALVAGAGLTGLVAAIALHRVGIKASRARPGRVLCCFRSTGMRIPVPAPMSLCLG